MIASSLTKDIDMYNNFDIVKTNKQKLIEDFMEGKVIYSKEYLENIFRDMFPEAEEGYFETVEKVKKMFLEIKDMFSLHDVCFIPVKGEIKEEEKAIIVRLVNLTQSKNINIIVLNDKIVYIGKGYDEVGMTDVDLYVTNLIDEYERDVFYSKLQCRVAKSFAPIFRLLGWIDSKKGYLNIDSHIEKNQYIKNLFQPVNRLSKFSADKS